MLNLSRRSRTVKTVFVVLASVALALPATAAALPNPATSSVAPDPSVLRAPDGSFHVYASSDNWDDGAGYRMMPHFRSFDLVEWQ